MFKRKSSTRRRKSRRRRLCAVNARKRIKILSMNNYLCNPNSHRSASVHVSTLIKGKMEQRNHAGVADVESKNRIVEVKHVSDWKHGLGQVLAYHYAKQTKSPVLALYNTNNMKQEKLSFVEKTCAHYNVELLIV